MAFLRAHPSSYDSWASEGADGWHYEALLPYFRAQRERCGSRPALARDRRADDPDADGQPASRRRGVP